MPQDAAGPPIMLQPILIVLHQEHSTPGRVGNALRQFGYPLDVRRPRFEDPLPQTMAEHAAAIIFGGPMSANDDTDFIRREIGWIAVPLKENKPFLGICLGAQMFAHHLALSVSWLPFTEMLASADAKLSPEQREVLILRVAWRTRSRYEWDQHSRMGADAGLTTAQIEAIAQGPLAAVWSPLERTLLTAVDEIIDDHVVGDTTWAGLASHFEPAQIFELLFVVGGYLCLAGVLNSIGLQSPLPSMPWGEPDRAAGEGATS